VKAEEEEEEEEEEAIKAYGGSGDVVSRILIVGTT
jgi:hypothetical protein